MASNLARMGSGLNQTPRSSPHVKPSPLKSPLKASNIEVKLKLREIIGTTVTSNNNFDCLESAKCFAFTAGATAVIATVNDDSTVSQRFFQARPGVPSSKWTTPLLDFGSSVGVSPSSRRGPANRSRDGGTATSYFNLPIRETSESPSNKKPSVREKPKATTCVSLSPNGKLLAVGETGHKPRVLIFSTCADSATDVPLTTLTDHTFGVRCVAFSRDSQYLATLGELNDGFLHVWSIDSRTGAANLYASNKCTSHIRNLVWLGSSLITVGTRHVKVWRIETTLQEPPQKKAGDISLTYSTDSGRALAGRNCILGPLLDQTFTDAVPISTERAIISSEQGDICMLVDTDASPQLVKIAEAGFTVNTLAVEAGKLLLAAGSRSITYALNDLSNTPVTTAASGLLLGSRVKLGRSPHQIKAMAFIHDRLITVDAQIGTRIFQFSHADGSATVATLASQPLRAHGSPIMGLQPLPAIPSLEARFLTWSANGTVLFWDYNGGCTKTVHVNLDRPGENGNELKIVRSCRDGKYLVSGDGFGWLRVNETCKTSDDRLLHDTKAHTGEITDVAIHETNSTLLIASAGRDRMVQIYCFIAEQFELVQTLDGHVGSVHKIQFNADGTNLFSCSSDRNIVVWDTFPRGGQGLAFLKARNIVLKSTPLSISPTAAQDGTLLVSTNDRQVLKYEARSGNLVSRFKLSDTEGEDSIVMSTLLRIPLSEHEYIVAGVSNTDKSIRVYDEGGRLLACEYGQTEGLTGIIMIENVPIQASGSRMIIATAGADGTVFLWEVSVESLHRQNSADAVDAEHAFDSSRTTLANKAPLRRVLSSSDVARLQELRAAQDNSDPQKGRPMDIPGHTRRQSKLSFSQTPDSKTGVFRRPIDSPTSPMDTRRTRRGSVHSSVLATSSSKEQSSAPRSIVPSSPGVQEFQSHRNSLGAVPSSGELNALVLATQQVCRNLHNYRKKLSTSQEVLPIDNARELERELGLTAKAIAEKAARSETAMVKLLDQYSEKLVELLDEKIEASVARQIGNRAEPSSGNGREQAQK